MDHFWHMLRENHFAGLPGGFRFNNGNFSSLGNSGYWWSSTESSSTHAWLRGLGYYYGSIDVMEFYKNAGFSVRCVKD
ncbi:MAG: hypothetical protein KQI35_16510 [Bacteroidetes bacterium]|nr:hypothetical protein [Bacteroidota bacterium]